MGDTGPEGVPRTRARASANVGVGYQVARRGNRSWPRSNMCAVMVNQPNSHSRTDVLRPVAGVDHWYWGEQFVPRRVGQTDRATGRCCTP